MQQGVCITGHTPCIDLINAEIGRLITVPVAKPSSNQLGIGQPAVYRIRIQGLLPPDWKDAVHGMQVLYTDSVDDGIYTTLTGSVADQAALAGILHLAFTLRMTLISVECLSIRSHGHTVLP